MRKAPSFLLLSVAVPALIALPVLSPPVAKPHPVTPEVRAVALAGVDDPSLRSSAGAASEEVSAEARADVLAPHQRGKAPSRPAVFTKARGTADFELLGVTWRAGTTADLTVLVRTHGETGWTEWTALDPAPTPDKSEGNDVRAGTEPLYAGPSDGYQVRIDVRSGTLPADVRVDLVDPGSPARTPWSAPVPRWPRPPRPRAAAGPHPRPVGRGRVATQRVTELLRHDQGGLRPPHRERQRLLRRRGAQDPSWHLRVPHAEQRLVGHRLQLPRRPLRPALGGPLRRHQQAGDGCTHRRVQHRHLRRLGDRQLRQGGRPRGHDRRDLEVLAWKLSLHYRDPRARPR